jgi:hypothetical protein
MFRGSWSKGLLIAFVTLFLVVGVAYAASWSLTMGTNYFKFWGPANNVVVLDGDGTVDELDDECFLYVSASLAGVASDKAGDGPRGAVLVERDGSDQSVRLESGDGTVGARLQLTAGGDMVVMLGVTE